MSTNLTLRNRIFPYPNTGDSNYGEAASEWAGEATDILGNVSGPGDIPTTEVTLSGSTDGTYTTGTITNLTFDTSFVQSIQVKGFITRTYTDATPTQVEFFTIEGAYNGTSVNYSVEFAGDETELQFTNTGGQFTFKYLDIVNTDSVTIKFTASAIVDSDLI